MWQNEEQKSAYTLRCSATGTISVWLGNVLLWKVLCLVVLLFEISLSFPFLCLVLNCPPFFSSTLHRLLSAVRERCIIVRMGAFLLSLLSLLERISTVMEVPLAVTQACSQQAKLYYPCCLIFVKLVLLPSGQKLFAWNAVSYLQVEKNEVILVAARWRKCRWSPV